MNPSETVIVIRSLVPGGVAQQDGRLVPGDRLMFVNDANLENASLDQAVGALKGAPRGVVQIGVAKPYPLPEIGESSTDDMVSAGCFGLFGSWCVFIWMQDVEVGPPPSLIDLSPPHTPPPPPPPPLPSSPPRESVINMEEDHTTMVSVFPSMCTHPTITCCLLSSFPFNNTFTRFLCSSCFLQLEKQKTKALARIFSNSEKIH